MQANYEVSNWCRKFGCAPDQARVAVSSVDPMVSDARPNLQSRRWAWRESGAKCKLFSGIQRIKLVGGGWVVFNQLALADEHSVLHAVDGGVMHPAPESSRGR